MIHALEVLLLPHLSHSFLTPDGLQGASYVTSVTLQNSEYFNFFYFKSNLSGLFIWTPFNLLHMESTEYFILGYAIPRIDCEPMLVCVDIFSSLLNHMMYIWLSPFHSKTILWVWFHLHLNSSFYFTGGLFIPPNNKTNNLRDTEIGDHSTRDFFHRLGFNTWAKLAGLGLFRLQGGISTLFIVH